LKNIELLYIYYTHINICREENDKIKANDTWKTWSRNDI